MSLCVNCQHYWSNGKGMDECTLHNQWADSIKECDDFASKHIGARSFFCNLPTNTAVGYVPPLKKTNADRIRSMTGEELAEFFVAIQNDVANYCDGGHAFEPDFPTHENAWLEWLKKEVKV